jgi:hypothetical protein
MGVSLLGARHSSLGYKRRVALMRLMRHWSGALPAMSPV